MKKIPQYLGNITPEQATTGLRNRGFIFDILTLYMCIYVERTDIKIDENKHKCVSLVKTLYESIPENKRIGRTQCLFGVRDVFKNIQPYLMENVIPIDTSYYGMLIKVVTTMIKKYERSMTQTLQ